MEQQSSLIVRQPQSSQPADSQVESLHVDRIGLRFSIYLEGGESAANARAGAGIRGGISRRRDRGRMSPLESQSDFGEDPCSGPLFREFNQRFLDRLSGGRERISDFAKGNEDLIANWLAVAAPRQSLISCAPRIQTLICRPAM